MQLKKSWVNKDIKKWDGKLLTLSRFFYCLAVLIHGKHGLSANIRNLADIATVSTDEILFLGMKMACLVKMRFSSIFKKTGKEFITLSQSFLYRIIFSNPYLLLMRRPWFLPGVIPCNLGLCINLGLICCRFCYKGWLNFYLISFQFFSEKPESHSYMR